MIENKLYIELLIENYPLILREYGRAVILTNNLEYFLMITIKRKGGKITQNISTLGNLIKDAEDYLPIKIIRSLKKLNAHRIKLVHGTVGTTKSFKTNKEWHFILKNDKETPIGMKSLVSN